jgi:SLT domain-containing protein
MAQLLLDAGASKNDIPALLELTSRESSWNPSAQNPKSTAYGLFQFLNGTWAGTGYQKSNDPMIQAKAGLQYIKNRYGTVQKALAFWDKNGWY